MKMAKVQQIFTIATPILPPPKYTNWRDWGCRHQTPGSDAPSRCGQWHATSAPCVPHQRRKAPCFSGLWGHHGCLVLSYDYPGCFEGCLPRPFAGHWPQPRCYSCRSLLHSHPPWNGWMPCILEPVRAKRPQSVGRNTARNNGTPTSRKN